MEVINTQEKGWETALKSGERSAVQTCVRRGKKATYIEKQQEQQASNMTCFQRMKKYY